MSIRGLRMESLLSPVAISVIAFALGYQVRNYFTPTAPSLRSSPSNPTPNSVPTPKDSSVIDLTDKSPSPGGNKGKGKSKKLPLPTSPSSASDSESEAEVDTDSEAEDLALALSSNPQSLKPTAFDEVKLVLVVNDSLHMTKGKIAAQAGHATLGCALIMKEVNPRMYKHWERHGQPKIALKCKDTEELEVLAAQARSLNLCARTIQDAWLLGQRRYWVSDREFPPYDCQMNLGLMYQWARTTNKPSNRQVEAPIAYRLGGQDSPAHRP